MGVSIGKFVWYTVILQYNSFIRSLISRLFLPTLLCPSGGAWMSTLCLFEYPSYYQKIRSRSDMGFNKSFSYGYFVHDRSFYKSLQLNIYSLGVWECKDALHVSFSPIGLSVSFTQCLEQNRLELNKSRGQSYDNGANIKGQERSPEKNIRS